MSQRKFIVQGEGLPQWTAPISHAVVVGKTCYISGQISVDEVGRYVSGPIREEATRAFSYFFAALRAAGFSPEEVVFVDIAFADLAEVEEVNALFAELFAEGRRPTRTIYQAAALPMGAKVKVLGVAIKD